MVHADEQSGALERVLPAYAVRGGRHLPGVAAAAPRAQPGDAAARLPAGRRWPGSWRARPARSSPNGPRTNGTARCRSEPAHADDPQPPVAGARARCTSTRAWLRSVGAGPPGGDVDDGVAVVAGGQRHPVDAALARRPAAPGASASAAPEEVPGRRPGGGSRPAAPARRRRSDWASRSWKQSWAVAAAAGRLTRKPSSALTWARWCRPSLRCRSTRVRVT